MATMQAPPRFTSEIAQFLASAPSPEKLLAFHPSAGVQQRAAELLRKQCEGRISAEEQWELDQFEHAEMLMQLIKATIRNGKAAQS